MLHRFFVDFPLRSGETVPVAGPLAHQIARVLRLRAGETVLLCDGKGSEYPLDLIVVAAGEVLGQVGPRKPVTRDPQVAITLYAAPLKGDHFAYTLQKATEVGVAAFVPIVTARTVASETGSAKLGRWQRIVREAAEQSGRGYLPPVAEPLPFAAACRVATAAGPAMIPWEEEQGRGLSVVLNDWQAQQGPIQQLALLIGPEGGFTAGEIAEAEAAGIVPVTLGPRILRAETAAIVAATLALATIGEL